jgi:predicted permease
MSTVREFTRRIGMLLHRERFAKELEDEMQLHLELRRQQQEESGVAPKESKAAAYHRFGNPTLLRERSYTAWGWGWLEGLLQDMLYGLRAMLHAPSVTIVALLSLALGIGANTAIFSLMDAVMLRSLPVKDPGKLVLLGTGEDWGVTNSFASTYLYSYPFYRQIQQRNQVFSSVAAIFSMHNDVHGTLEGRREPEPMHVQLVSGTYFSTLGVSAARGRVFTDMDDRIPGGNPVAVVSNSWWKKALARNPNVLNRTLKLGETTYSIVGVAPPEFYGTKVGEAPDIWIPLSMSGMVPPYPCGDTANCYKNDFAESLDIFGRLKPGVSVSQATTNVNLLFQQILRGFPDAELNQRNLDRLKKAWVPLTSMATGISELRSEFSDPLKILMAIVSLVLLIACANIANLLLARSTARAREFAVRQALGAQRARLVRQLLTESLLLALVGGVLGVLSSLGATRLLLRMVSGGQEAVPLDVSVDTHVLAFTLATTFATALLFGMIPAFRATKFDLSRSLKEGRGGANAGNRSPLGKMLVITQVAFSLVLVVGASLFLRSLVNLNRADMGFDKENVLRLDVDAGSAGYKADDPQLKALYREIEERVVALPGVHAASFSFFTFHEGSWNTHIVIPGYQVDRNINIKHNVVGNGYFATMRIPLLVGRSFGPEDTATSQKVAIISEHTARTMFPKGSPIGRHYYIGDPKDGNDREVIGIAKDVKFDSVQENVDRLDYIPYTQYTNYFLNDFEVRYTGDFGAIASAVQRTIHEIDHNLPISNVTTLDEQVARSYTDQRIVAQLSTFFGLLAVFLSGIGIYGLMSYVVSRRTNEIGIRMALGADRMHVRWRVMREVLLLVAVGVAIGAPAALLSSRLVASMLFGLRANDSFSLIVAILIMLAIAALAGYLPARRASRVDPMVALRYE